MQKITYLLAAICFSVQLFAQTNTVDNFEFEFKKAYKNGKFEAHTSSYYIKPGKNQKRIQVRFKVKSTNNDKVVFDPNKFYLISDTYKVRLRPVDIKHSHVMHTYLEFQRLVALENPNSKDKSYWYRVDNTIEDTFVKYRKDGYEDVETKLNFGTKKKPNIKAVYFKPKPVKSKTIDVYFIVPKNFKTGEMYYANQEIATIQLKK